MLNFLKAYVRTYLLPICWHQPIDYSKEVLVGDISTKDTDKLPVSNATESTVASIDVDDIETIRYSAYLLAESDGFKHAPAHYWALAEAYSLKQ